jgi:high affinity Mn2+ porin
MAWRFPRPSPVLTAAIVIASAGIAAADDVIKSPATSYFGPPYNWNGFYAGGHLGVAWGNSNWTAAPGITGSTNLFQPINSFNESGSFFTGVQSGYNYVLPNRVVVGAEADALFPSFPSLTNLTIGGTSNFTSPTLGGLSYSETALAMHLVTGCSTRPAALRGPIIIRR